MSRTYDGWIFTKTRKFAPTGRIQIGQVLAKPFQPESALMPHGPLPVPEDLVLDEAEDTNMSLYSGHDLKAMFKMWADLNPIPVTTDADFRVDHSTMLSWHFDSLKSKQYSLTLKYIQESMEHDEVPDYLKNWRWDKRVFIITGVTIAEGARMVKKDAKSAGICTSGSGDPSGTWSMRAGGAGEVKGCHSNEEATGWSSNFVFAYSVNEVFYRKITHNPFRKGEVQSIGSESRKEVEDDHADNLIDAVVVDDVAEEHYQGGDEDVDKEEDYDI